MPLKMAGILCNLSYPKGMYNHPIRPIHTLATDR
jgi:hypothetical protein